MTAKGKLLFYREEDGQGYLHSVHGRSRVTVELFLFSFSDRVWHVIDVNEVRP